MMADTADLERAIRERAIEIMTRVGDDVAAATAAAAPVSDTSHGGTLRDAHRADPPIDLGDVIACDIVADTDYAQYVAEGTSAHIIRPVTAKALKFTVDGQTVFAAVVNHPGTTANTEWWSPEAIADRYRSALDAEVS